MKLVDLLNEYCNSLVRADAERELQKDIVQKAEVHFQFQPKVFRRHAAALHKDKMDNLRDETAQQQLLLEAAEDADSTVTVVRP
jgi:hypothetical protein